HGFAVSSLMDTTFKISDRICLHFEWRRSGLGSSKQSTTAMFAIEAEYIDASEAAMEAVWIRKFILGLGARHYHRRYHYVRECIELGEISLLKVHTDDNLADQLYLKEILLNMLGA
ncbi:hypothetical protein Tco_0181640, partial [Tanacetum coccineum]